MEHLVYVVWLKGEFPISLLVHNFLKLLSSVSISWDSFREGSHKHCNMSYHPPILFIFSTIQGHNNLFPLTPVLWACSALPMRILPHRAKPGQCGTRWFSVDHVFCHQMVHAQCRATFRIRPWRMTRTITLTRSLHSAARITRVLPLVSQN